jgi:hypothetical protein
MLHYSISRAPSTLTALPRHRARILLAATIITSIFPQLTLADVSTELDCAASREGLNEGEEIKNAQKQCPTLHQQLRGHPGALEAAKTCVRVQVSLAGAHRELCGVIEGSRADIATISAEAKRSQQSAEDSTIKLLQTSGVNVHKSEVKSEDVKVLLQLRGQELRRAMQSLNDYANAESKKPASRAGSPSPGSTLIANYQKGIQELKTIEKKLTGSLSAAEKVKAQFRETHRSLQALLPGAEIDKLRLTTMNQMTTKTAQELEVTGNKDAEYLGARAKGIGLSAAANASGLETSLERTAATNTAGLLLRSASGEGPGSATAAAAQILTSTAKEEITSAVSGAARALPFVGSVAGMGVGAGVSVLTSPTTANLPEVAPENFAREAQGAGIQYDDGISGPRPLGISESIRIQKLRDQYGGAPTKSRTP